ncbi:DUF3168 domain-containing protein [Neptuniibacter sp.]|uniref:DUF3168 domain-containing protein n=1 Tax=Neptuniibacter sp. TaxID=1962643 RepID=UPI002607231F|nr:DUF3168 domain-containing protein [Neptuniibacter sp.]MCP4597793.1 DUF3168 domain-containing protein [Neptuniibacter sp.]
MTEQQLFTLLKDAPGITGVAQVYNNFLPEKYALPAITFGTVSDIPITTLNGNTGNSKARYSISVWSGDYTELKSLEAAVLTAMSDYVHTATIPLHEPDKYLFRLAIDYSVFR